MNMPTRKTAGRLPFAAVEQDRGRLVVREDQQDEGEDQHAGDLGRHADVVDERQQPDAERVDERRRDEHDDREERLHVRHAERIG
jgi:hypothetical protein